MWTSILELAPHPRLVRHVLLSLCLAVRVPLPPWREPSPGVFFEVARAPAGDTAVGESHSFLSPSFQCLFRSQGRGALTLGPVETAGLPLLWPPLGFRCRPLCRVFSATHRHGLPLFLLFAPNCQSPRSGPECFHLSSGTVSSGWKASVFSSDSPFQDLISLESSIFELTPPSLYQGHL